MSTTKQILRLIRATPNANQIFTGLVTEVGPFLTKTHYLIIKTPYVAKVVHQTDTRFTNKQIYRAIGTCLRRAALEPSHHRSNDRWRLVDKLKHREFVANLRRQVQHKIINEQPNINHH